LVSSLLNVAYLMPLVGRGFFLSEDQKVGKSEFSEGPVLVWLPPALTALGCIVLFFYAGHIQEFLMPIVSAP
jgi:multicomponent Na+:H+ antiporter subunit D